MARTLTWKAHGDFTDISHVAVTLTDTDSGGAVTRSHVPGQCHHMLAAAAREAVRAEPRDRDWWTPTRLQVCAEAERGLSKMDWHLDDQKGEIAMRSNR